MTSRRKFISLIGGGIVVAAGAGAAGFTLTRTPKEAIRPWNNPGASYSDMRKRFLSYAILAPNPHNQQPWMVDLSRENEIGLYIDKTRLLPHTDPFNRQITIGLGCFLELLIQAAAEEGYLAEPLLFPEGQSPQSLGDEPIAIVNLRKSNTVAAEPLFRSVLDRRSLKEPFDLNRPVESSVLDHLEKATLEGVFVNSTNVPRELEALREISWQAYKIEIQTPRTFKESIDVMRFGKAEINANPDGIDLGGAFLETLMFFGMLTRENIGEVGSTAYKQGLDMYREMLFSSQGYIWLVTNENQREDQINAGRSWVRTNLAATEAGIGIHPISQALQEYPEMSGLYQLIHKTLAPSGGTVQMLGRLGYAPLTPPTPRWSIDHKTKSV